VHQWHLDWIDRKSLRVRDGVKHDREGIIALARVE
jgi:hypothetical protein